uniref:hypothetical protein n=1 Tax=Bradyrhizobium sp. (strain ORS 278) TaxID=114615 RepID=UPI0012FF5061|nr:hypothetical protein [Bradyrhizobium sp. ORS 278]
MKTSKEAWGAAQLGKHTKQRWSELRPTTIMRQGMHAASRQFAVGGEQPVVPGLRLGTSIHGLWKDAGELAMIRVFAQLHDERVASMWSIVDGQERSVHFADFDIISTSQLLFGRPEQTWPVIAIDDVEHLDAVLRMYSGLIDEIWLHFGGYDRAGFEALALWLISAPRDAGQTVHGLGGACAAFLYGVRDRAFELLCDLESSWNERLANEPDRPVVVEVHRSVIGSIERAREAFG